MVLKLPLFMGFSFFIFILGLCIGSFLNVCIYRLPRGESLLHPPSHCPQCGNLIKWWDNIPLLSYLLLKGRCRYCSRCISFRYPLVEALTGIFFLFSFFYRGPGTFSFPTFLTFFKDLVFISFLIPVFFIDLDHRIVPNSLSYGVLVSGLLFSLLTGSFYSNLVGLGIGGGIFLTIRLLGALFLKVESMGMGDVKLAMGIGAFLGWREALVCFFLSFLLGAIVAIFLLLTRVKGRKDRIAFAPFLVAAALISLFWGEKFFSLYLTFVCY
ncbi:MAG: prepilin peptidase [bacterium]